MPASPIPPGYHAVTPYLIVEGAAQAIAWYSDIFSGRELMRLAGGGNKIAHAEIEVGDSRVMLADEAPAHDAMAPKAFGGSPVSLHLYVADVDATFTRAVAAGATAKSAPADQFYGDRLAAVVDPFGHTWHIATHFEDVPQDEIERRLAAITTAA